MIEGSTGRDWNLLPLIPDDFICDSLNAESAIELTTSWLAINLFEGCSFGCAYCFRYRWNPQVSPEEALSVDDAVTLLTEHPLFMAHLTPLTVNVRSTDPLHPRVRESTISLMEALDSRGLRNPFGVVTKGTLRPQDAERIAALGSIRPVILVSYSAMPIEIEPIPRQVRVSSMQVARQHDLAVIVSYKPVVAGWNDERSKISDVMRLANDYAAAIIVGGLRLDTAIAAAIEKRGAALGIEIPLKWGGKELAPETLTKIDDVHREICPHVPLYRHTSCAVSLVMQMQNYNALRRRSPELCSKSCPAMQVRRCEMKGSR